MASAGASRGFSSLNRWNSTSSPARKSKPASREPRQRVAQNLPRRERHRLAVGEIDVAQEPAGVRRRHRSGHGKTRNVAGSATMTKSPPPCISAMPKPPPGGEHRIGGLVRRVLGKQRRRHGDAASHQRRRVRGHDGLAAQHAVLIGEREAHQFELVFLDRLRDRLGARAPARRSTGRGARRRFRGCDGGRGAIALCANSEWRMASRVSSLSRFAIRASRFADLPIRPAFGLLPRLRRCAASSPASRPPARCRRRRPGR